MNRAPRYWQVLHTLCGRLTLGTGIGFLQIPERLLKHLPVHCRLIGFQYGFEFAARLIGLADQRERAREVVADQRIARRTFNGLRQLKLRRRR